MHIIYGDISLGIVAVRLFEEEPVYDATGTDLIMTRYSIAVTAVVNGQAEVREHLAPTSYTDTGAVGDAYVAAKSTKPAGVPLPAPPLDAPASRNLGTFAAAVGIPREPGFIHPLIASPPSRMVSDVTRSVRILAPGPNSVPLSYNLIAERLKQPRLRLFVFAEDGDADSLLLMSPSRWDYVCDAKNGPTPKLLSINEIHGDGQTFVVEWQIETYLSAVNTLTSPPPILLSNRFSVTHILDATSKLTIQVQGEARFRTDELYLAGVNPDLFRVNLFQPIPRFFTRDQIQVTLLPDETGVTYSYVDVEQPIRFAAGPYSGGMSIHIDHHQSMDTGCSLGQQAIDTYREYIGLKANMAMAKMGTHAHPNPFMRLVGQKLTP